MEHTARVRGFMNDKLPYAHQNASRVNSSLNIQAVNFINWYKNRSEKHQANRFVRIFVGF